MDLAKNVALIGFGLAGRKFHAPQISAVEGLKLAAIVSSRQADIRADYPDVAILSRPEEVFADPAIDLVVVATPNEVHASLAAAALRAGKAVVVDKPFTRSVTETEALIAVAKETGGLLSVYQNRRWDGDFLTLKRLIAEGALGEIVYVETHFDRFRPAPSGNWREKVGAANGIWYDLGPHLADQAMCLFGPPKAVYADLANLRPFAQATDYFHVLLRYDGLRVVLMGNYLAADDNLRFVVHGSKASFVMHGYDSGEAAASRPGKAPAADWNGPTYKAVLVDGRGAEHPVAVTADVPTGYYAGVRDALTGKAALPVSAEEGLRVMKVLDLGEQSGAEGRELPFA